MRSQRDGKVGVLVDRDGTLIREVGHLCRVEQLEILPGVPEAIRLLRRYGLKVAVITNQSAVARGLLKEEELREIHREMERRLAEGGAVLDGLYYCPHHPTEGGGPYRVACECRKPRLGLPKRAALELDLDLARSYVVGDQQVDMELAAGIGAKGLLIGDKKSREDKPLPAAARRVVTDFWEAAQWIVGDLTEGKGMTGRA